MDNTSKQQAKSIQDQVVGLFEYCGKQKAGAFGNYSPNNIKRLIIAPDGIVVVYHLSKFVPHTNGKDFRVQLYDYRQLQMEQSKPGYKPIISLALKRVCSSIEEIIFLTQSRDNQVVGFLERESDLRDTNSFVRLHYATIINLNIFQFMQGYSSLAGSDFISDADSIAQYIQYKKVIVDKYYLEWGSSKSKSTYPFEMKHLSPYFSKIKLDKETALKEQAIKSKEDEITTSEDKENEDKAKDKERKERLDYINKQIPLYKKLFAFNQSFNKLLGAIESSSSTSPYKFEQLHKVEGLRVEDYFIKDTGLSEDEALEADCKYLGKFKVNMFQGYLSFFLRFVLDLYNEHPIAAIALFNNCSLKVPKQVDTFSKQLVDEMNTCSSKLGFNFDKCDIDVMNTLSGVAAMYCTYIVFDGSVTIDNKYKEASYWQQKGRL